MCQTNKATMKVLFIGNSATYVHEIPQTLSQLAKDAGYEINVTVIAKGGYELSQHADAESEHGKLVLEEIAHGSDIVFLQDNGNCISSPEKSENSSVACHTLTTAIRASNALPYLYVRPPYGKPSAGFSPLEQCEQFDALFSAISSELNITAAYANRAFAYAIKHLDLPLWGPDNAHTSPQGAYLIVCVLFATLFQTSSTVLGLHELPKAEAASLQQVADKIVLEGILPW